MHLEAMAHLRRSVSAPSLDSLVDSALSMEATPCSVLDRNSTADDEVSLSLRQTLAETHRELQAAVEAGVLELAGGGGNSSNPSGGTHPRPCTSANASEGEDEPEASAAATQRRGGGGARQASSSGCASGGGSAGTGHSLQLELELAGLSAREREAALKRAKNREAARRWGAGGSLAAPRHRQHAPHISNPPAPHAAQFTMQQRRFPAARKRPLRTTEDVSGRRSRRAPPPHPAAPSAPPAPPAGLGSARWSA